MPDSENASSHSDRTSLLYWFPHPENVVALRGEWQSPRRELPRSLPWNIEQTAHLRLVSRHLARICACYPRAALRLRLASIPALSCKRIREEVGELVWPNVFCVRVCARCDEPQCVLRCEDGEEVCEWCAGDRREEEMSARLLMTRVSFLYNVLVVLRLDRRETAHFHKFSASPQELRWPIDVLQDFQRTDSVKTCAFFHQRLSRNMTVCQVLWVG